VGVNPVDCGGEGGGVFAEVVGVEGGVVLFVSFEVGVDGACGDCEGAVGGDFA